jgi:hypothetical protein
VGLVYRMGVGQRESFAEVKGLTGTVRRARAECAKGAELNL